MATTLYGNYVKFIRGTEASWSLIPEEQKSSDTLYFISNVNSTTGKLYLGSKLISNGSLSSATSLEELNDVFIKENITDQSILIYNAVEKIWENKSIADIFFSINEVFKGADENNDGVAGLVPAPKKGQYDLYLRGDGTWANPVSNVSTAIEGLQAVVNNLVGTDTDKSIREVAREESSNAIATIVAQAPEQFDTLKEIADWIQSNQGSVDVAGLTTRVSSLENILYGVEANPENGTEETIGLIEVVSALHEDYTTIDATLEEHTLDLAEIKAMLRWQDITENNV